MEKGIVFLCTHNSARSQLAEALGRSILPPEIHVFSAGTQPATVNPHAVDALAEWGISGQSLSSKHLDEIPLDKVSLVITLCDDAAANCPTLPGIRTEHWPFPDPSSAAEAERPAAFRTVRDALVGKLRKLAKANAPEPAIGIIGGSGFYDLPGVEDLTEYDIDTPFGKPSDVLFVGRLDGKRVVFLPRHGRGHKLLPMEVNARANLYALKRMGVTTAISVSAVGSLKEEIAPGHVVVPRQFIDRSMHRPATFFGGGVVAHVSLANPMCNELADKIAAAAEDEGATVHGSGTYLSMEGPQFSTRAESNLYRSWGCDIVGMTNATEATVAREAEIAYATMALPTDYDCWRAPEEEVSIGEIIAVLQANVEKAQKILRKVIGSIDAAACPSCGYSLDAGLMTPLEAISPAAAFRLQAVLSRRLMAAETSPVA